ncbi:DinB family protein [Solicola sp. PLA-1-18]|uniref:DinB family protein n=1 Tax=Solicola sp. PLA-1-18 TaxID=3380532 RepID=UPI003B76E850
MSVWTAPAVEPADGPLVGDERPMLQAMLDSHRAALLHTCRGLTGEQLAARAVPPSTLSLLGLVRHLRKVERVWLRVRFGGEDVPALHGFGTDAVDVDFDQLDPSRAREEHEALVEEWHLADAAVAGLPLDAERVVRGETMSLRLVYLHLIGEYAHHTGHADLLRERIDGVTAR